MSRYLRLFVVLFSLSLLGTSQVSAQCFSFAKNVCKPALENFVHDGNYNSTILTEGESADLYKTFFAGQKYRIVIGKVDDLPKIHFKIISEDDEVLFDNKEYDYAQKWDFEVETTQQLIVHLEVPDKNKKSETKTSGCVAILFGIESK